MLIYIGRCWEYDPEKKLASFNDKGISKPVFRLESSEIPAVNNIYASEDKAKVNVYKCKDLQTDKTENRIEIPLGIIRRVIEYQKQYDSGNLLANIISKELIVE